tara:strand:+ start:180 stop:881 length:702 start_codon:yes stop_codon:yes gene_type:complete
MDIEQALSLERSDVLSRQSVGDEAEYYHNLTLIMQKTCGARFMASEILKKKEVISLGMLSALSINIILLSMLLMVWGDKFSGEKVKIFGIILSMASIAVLVISIFEYAIGRGVLADKLHGNALSITKIMRTLERELKRETPNSAVLEDCAAKYEEINIETRVNHSSEHYDLFIRQRALRLSKNIARFAAMKVRVNKMRCILMGIWPTLLVFIFVSSATVWITIWAVAQILDGV